MGDREQRGFAGAVARIDWALLAQGIGVYTVLYGAVTLGVVYGLAVVTGVDVGLLGLVLILVGGLVLAGIANADVQSGRLAHATEPASGVFFDPLDFRAKALGGVQIALLFYAFGLVGAGLVALALSG